MATIYKLTSAEMGKEDEIRTFLGKGTAQRQYDRLVAKAEAQDDYDETGGYNYIALDRITLPVNLRTVCKLVEGVGYAQNYENLSSWQPPVVHHNAESLRLSI